MLRVKKKQRVSVWKGTWKLIELTSIVTKLNCDLQKLWPALV